MRGFAQPRSFRASSLGFDRRHGLANVRRPECERPVATVATPSAVQPTNPSAPPPSQPKLADGTDALAAEKLLALLASMFKVSEFRIWIHLGPSGSTLLSRLPEGSYTASQFYYEAVQAFHAEGHLDQEFRERLIKARPHRADEIRAIDIKAVCRTLTRGFRPHESISRTRLLASIIAVAVLVIGNGVLVAYIAGIGPFLVPPPPVETRPAEPVKPEISPEPPRPPSIETTLPPEIQRLHEKMKDDFMKLAATKQPILTFRGKIRRIKHQGEVLFISSIELKQIDLEHPPTTSAGTP